MASKILHLEKQIRGLKRELSASRHTEKVAVRTWRKVQERHDALLGAQTRNDLTRDMEELMLRSRIDSLMAEITAMRAANPWLLARWYTTVTEALLNWYAVRRLGRDRWESMVEAGYTTDINTTRRVARRYLKWDREEKRNPWHTRTVTVWSDPLSVRIYHAITSTIVRYKKSAEKHLRDAARNCLKFAGLPGGRAVQGNKVRHADSGPHGQGGAECFSGDGAEGSGGDAEQYRNQC